MGGSSTSFDDPHSLITMCTIRIFRLSTEGSLIHLVPPFLHCLPCSLMNKFCFFSVNTYVCCGAICNEMRLAIKPTFSQKSAKTTHTHTHWLVMMCYPAILHNDKCAMRSTLPFETSLYVTIDDALLTCHSLAVSGNNMDYLLCVEHH